MLEVLILVALWTSYDLHSVTRGRHEELSICNKITKKSTVLFVVEDNLLNGLGSKQSTHYRNQLK